jgi:hypothetical protein
MSTIVEILRSTEEVQLPDGTRTLASEEALRQSLRESLQESLRLKRLKHQERHGLGVDARRGDARSPDARSSDTNHSVLSARPEVRVVGRVSHPIKPIRSAKSTIVPEPDQIQSKRPEPRPVVGPLEPRG